MPLRDVSQCIKHLLVISFFLLLSCFSSISTPLPSTKSLQVLLFSLEPPVLLSLTRFDQDDILVCRFYFAKYNMIVDILPLVVDALPILVCEPEPYAVDLGLVGGDIVRASRFYHVVQTAGR